MGDMGAKRMEKNGDSFMMNRGETQLEQTCSWCERRKSREKKKRGREEEEVAEEEEEVLQLRTKQPHSE